MAVGDESPDVKLAVAVNDIDWMKQTMTDTRDAVKDLSEYVKTQATKQDMAVLEQRVRKLENWRNWLTGAYIVIAGLFVMTFEYGRQWVTGGGGHP